MPLQFAGILIEGGIIGYDSGLESGGTGYNFLGIGPTTQYSKDVITISLRAVSVNTGNAVDGNSLPINKDDADAAFAAAMCIGCGACVAACKNSSAMLFLSAKVSHLAQLPQGEPERKSRVLNMVAQMDKEGFGSCTNTGACEAACPKEISIANIARLNKEYLRAGLTQE